METSGRICPNVELIQALMHVIITCKYEKDSIKNSREKVETSHYKPMGVFSDVQGQLTPQSVVRAGRNSNSSELSCMSSLPASMKRIGWKTGEKKWRHSFLHYNPMGAFCCHGNQSSDPIWPKTKCSLFPQPNDASDKIWLRSTRWFQRYSCLKVWTHRRTDARTHGRTPARPVSYKLTLWAFGSGELKTYHRAQNVPEKWKKRN